MTSSHFRGQIWLAGASSLISSLRPLLVRQVRIADERIREQATADPHEARLGDLLIDLTPPCDPVDRLQACHDRGVLYLSAPRPLGAGRCYDIYTNVRNCMRRWPNPWGATALLEHGAAPGLVSHLAKRALADFARSRLRCQLDAPRRLALETALVEDDFPRLGLATGVCSIHAVTASHAKASPEVATEVGWGTHETSLPPGSDLPDEGPRNQLALPRGHRSTDLHSWQPSGPLRVQAVGRADAFTLSDHLTLWDAGRVVYRPTVVAAQSRQAAGLSVLLLDRTGPVWWAGWNTKPCDAVALAAAASWIVRHPRNGVRVPDDLPAEAMLDQVRPWLGEVVSRPLFPAFPTEPIISDSQFVSLLV